MGTELDELNVSSENRAGVVMWRTKMQARYKNADNTPIIDAGTAF
jgi:hypothetical protein